MEADWKEDVPARSRGFWVPPEPNTPSSKMKAKFHCECLAAMVPDKWQEYISGKGLNPLEGERDHQTMKPIGLRCPKFYPCCLSPF